MIDTVKLEKNSELSEEELLDQYRQQRISHSPELLDQLIMKRAHDLKPKSAYVLWKKPVFFSAFSAVFFSAFIYLYLSSDKGDSLSNYEKNVELSSAEITTIDQNMAPRKKLKKSLSKDEKTDGFSVSRNVRNVPVVAKKEVVEFNVESDKEAVVAASSPIAGPSSLIVAPSSVESSLVVAPVTDRAITDPEIQEAMEKIFQLIKAGKRQSALENYLQLRKECSRCMLPEQIDELLRRRRLHQPLVDPIKPKTK